MSAALQTPPGTPPATTAPYARRWQGLAVLGLSLLIIGIDNTILNVALPTLVRELGASGAQLQWMVDSYVLVFAGLLLSAGALGDRFGRKGALTFGLVLFGASSLLASRTNSPEQLIAVRALMGIGGAFIMPATLSIMTNMFPPEERGRAIGIWAGIAGIGIPLGPVAGGYLLEHYHWSAIFLVNVPVVVLALALGAVLLPTSRDPNSPRVDIPGALLSISGIGILVWGLIEAPARGWTSGTILGAFAVSAALQVAFAIVEMRTREPMLDMRFFKNPRFTAANAAITLVFFAMFGSMFGMTQYLQFILGYAPLEAGVRMLPMAAGMIIGAPVSARLVEHVGTKIVVAAGLTVVAVALLLLSRVEAGTGYGWFVGCMLLMAIGMGLTMAPSTEAVMGSIPRSRAGVGSAMNDTTRQIGGALGVAVLGSLISSVYRGRMDEAVAGLPPTAAQAAHDSLGGALQVAARVGPAGGPLAEVARESFLHAMAIGLRAGAAVALVGAVIALVFLPAEGVDAGLDFED
ncbi:MAG: DHA2 family efflux MFS transporter permease subunit [Dehalococcoidia bacterium]|nr:MAG: DHA2 family efflux MFS transporter permease subunit [Dehalococcoidia bacterium]